MSDVPPPAINVNWVALNFVSDAQLQVEAGFIANYGAYKGEIELLAHSAGGALSALTVEMSNGNGKGWTAEVPNLIGSLLQPLMGWTGMQPGPLQEYEHQIPPVVAPYSPQSSAPATVWTFKVTGTIYGKRTDPDTLHTTPVEVPVNHELTLPIATVSQMKDWSA